MDGPKSLTAGVLPRKPQSRSLRGFPGGHAISLAFRWLRVATTGWRRRGGGRSSTPAAAPSSSRRRQRTARPSRAPCPASEPHRSSAPIAKPPPDAAGGRLGVADGSYAGAASVNIGMAGVSAPCPTGGNQMLPLYSVAVTRFLLRLDRPGPFGDLLGRCAQVNTFGFGLAFRYQTVQLPEEGFTFSACLFRRAFLPSYIPFWRFLGLS